jgi:hypothetical protein
MYASVRAAYTVIREGEERVESGRMRNGGLGARSLRIPRIPRIPRIQSSRRPPRPDGHRRRAVAMATLFLTPAASLGAGELRVLLEGVAGLRSDGNYLQSAEPVPTTSGEARQARQHTVARGGLNLDLGYHRPRLDFALGYSPTYEESLRNRDLNGVTHRLRLGMTGNLSRRTTLSLSERLIASPNLELVAITPTDVPETMAVPRRGDELIHRADAGLTVEITPHTSYLLSVENMVRTFSAAGLVDSNTIGASAGFGFHRSERSEVQVLAGASRFDFRGVRTADVATGTIAYRRTTGRDSHFRIEGGAFTVTATDLATGIAEARRSGVRGEIGWNALRERWSWSAGYRHDVAPGIGLGRPVLVDDAFAGIGTVGRRASLGLDVNASRSRDLGTRIAVRPLTEFAAATLHASWAFTDWGRLDGGVSRIYQRARVPGFDNLSYSRFFLGVALRLYSRGVAAGPPDQGGLIHAQPNLR